MTSKTITLTGSEKETFPDLPPRDDMQNWLYLYDTAIVSSLAIHFGDFPTPSSPARFRSGRACQIATTREYPT